MTTTKSVACVADSQPTMSAHSPQPAPPCSVLEQILIAMPAKHARARCASGALATSLVAHQLPRYAPSREPRFYEGTTDETQAEHQLG
jgi:hypothetical protein